MMNKALKPACLLLLTITSPYTHSAILGQGTTAAGTAFASAASGNQAFSSLGQPGDAIMGGVSTQYVNAQTSTSAVGGTASASASNSGSANGYPFSNHASGSATPGTIKLSAYNNGSTATAFPGGSANAGWNDMFTLTGGGANGTTGIWIAPIVLNGSMSAVGNGASGTFQVAAYKNYNVLQPYGNALNSQAYNAFTSLNTTHNGSDKYSSWDYQMAGFGVVDYGPSDTDTLQTLTVTNRVINFAIPFTWGTAFEAGFYANLMAGERASGGFVGQNTTDLNFSHTLTWGGPGYVIGNGGNITNFNIASTSGFDYSSAAVPLPATLWLFGSGLIGLLGMAQRKAA